MLQTIRTQLLDPSNGILWQSCYPLFLRPVCLSLQDCHPAAAAGTRCVLRRALLHLALVCLSRAATVSRWYVCWSPKLTTGHKRIWDLLETMRSDLSVWTNVACMSWFGADLYSMALNGWSHVLEPWISHVVHISFAQRLSHFLAGTARPFAFGWCSTGMKAMFFSFPRGLCHIWDVNGCPKANLPQQISNLPKGGSVNWDKKCVGTEGKTAYSW